MTFFHFVNCIVLSYAPYVIAFKYSGLSEYSTIWKCAQAGFGYLLTQLAKLLILATFFPAGESEGFSVFPELLKSLADVVDLVGLHLIMTYLMSGKGEIRFLSGGLGWGAAHALASRVVLYWVGARASAFSWRWIQLSLDSSADLFFFVSVAALVWMATRSHNRQLVFALLLACVMQSFIFQFMYAVAVARGWLLVAARFAYSLVIAGGTIVAYSNSFNKREQYNQ